MLVVWSAAESVWGPFSDAPSCTVRRQQGRSRVVNARLIYLLTFPSCCLHSLGHSYCHTTQLLVFLPLWLSLINGCNFYFSKWKYEELVILFHRRTLLMGIRNQYWIWYKYRLKRQENSQISSYLYTWNVSCKTVLNSYSLHRTLQNIWISVLSGGIITPFLQCAG